MLTIASFLEQIGHPVRAKEILQCAVLTCYSKEESSVLCLRTMKDSEAMLSKRLSGITVKAVLHYGQHLLDCATSILQKLQDSGSTSERGRARKSTPARPVATVMAEEDHNDGEIEVEQGDKSDKRKNRHGRHSDKDGETIEQMYVFVFAHRQFASIVM